jgi:hypothetical protein
MRSKKCASLQVEPLESIVAHGRDGSIHAAIHMRFIPGTE